MDKNFQIFRSSAGSGKTYTLALSFIALALEGGRYGYEDYYRKILAITFTNKAAAEMKARVLGYLYSLGEKKDKDGVLDWLKKETRLTEGEIFERAALVHKHILHNYADLNISTIDKFTYKIVRTFAIDLGLSHNFDLEMDTYKIIQPVVALLLSKISKSGGTLSSTLVNFAMQKAEDGKSTNIEKDLEDFSQQLFREEVSEFTNGRLLTVSQCMRVRKDLQTSKKNITKKIEDLSNRACLFFDSQGLTNEHFLRGTFYNHFSVNVGHKQDKRWMPSEALVRNIANDVWYAEGKEVGVKDLVDSLKPQLNKFFTELMDLLTQYNSVISVLRNMYPIAVLNELMKEIHLYKKENNIEQISAFNAKIHKVVANQPSSFIYERLGERYNHYLIDEFQDTSLLQWQNILPLITDSLDYGKSLVVGDGKQSIYRWRGGEVEQFYQLPNIYKGKNLFFKREWERKLNFHFNPNHLADNFRSRKHIIEFNNRFFERTRDLLSEDIIGIYTEQEQTTNFAQDGGYIHIELFGDKEHDFKALILEKIVDEINKLVAKNNYDFKDIAILCNSRKSVALVAESLSATCIPVISNEGLLLHKSAKVNVIISLLRYLKNPKDTIARLVMVDYLFNTVLKKEDLHILNLKIKTDKEFKVLLRQVNIHLDSAKILQEPLYEMIEQLIRLFKLKEDIYLDFFLDVVLMYVEKQGSSLTEFLIWWEDRKLREAIVIPKGTNAVQVMTIHKSKGLAFNVVMIPFNWEDRKSTQDIWVDTSSYFNKDLPVALINGNKNLRYSYFNEEYKKEEDMALLDSLNKLYVAMTRPKERLYIFSKFLPNKISSNFVTKGNLNSFLYQYDGDFPVIIGDAGMMREDKEEVLNTFSVVKRKKLDWREVISLKHTAEAIWDTEVVDEKRDWGKLLHLILAEIYYYEQKDSVLDSFLKLGKCTKEDYKRLKVTIKNLLDHNDVMPYFTEVWQVKTEKEILIGDGRTYIPDRLLFSKDMHEVVVIEYKTGVRRDKHIQQISEYAIALEKMGKSNVKKVLIYTSEPVRVEVL